MYGNNNHIFGNSCRAWDDNVGYSFENELYVRERKCFSECDEIAKRVSLHYNTIKVETEMHNMTQDLLFLIGEGGYYE